MAEILANCLKASCNALAKISSRFTAKFYELGLCNIKYDTQSAFMEDGRKINLAALGVMTVTTLSGVIFLGCLYGKSKNSVVLALIIIFILIALVTMACLAVEVSSTCRRRKIGVRRSGLQYSEIIPLDSQNSLMLTTVVQ